MKRRVEPILIAALCGLLGWFYVWTAHSSARSWGYGREQVDYYNRLIDGWLAGQLHMKVDVPDALLRLPDPYDPQQRAPGLALHDASFYRGKYYLYFGAAPMVTLMLPWRLITGTDLPQPAAVVIFVLGGFGASVLVWLAVRRRYFPAASTAVVLLGILALGMLGLGPVLVRRPDVWELPIAGGYFFAMLGLGGVWRALHAERPTRWLVAAAACFGLAVASRATYLFGLGVLLVPFWAWRREGVGVLARRALLAGLPLALIGGALALHNYARFGDPLEFGQKYQMSSMYEAKVTHFAARYVPFNAWLYFWAPAEWSAFFPFIKVMKPAVEPAGYGGTEDVFGLLRTMPFAWLALAAPLALRREHADGRLRLGAWLGGVVALVLPMAVLLLFFFGAHGRYMLDFAPAITLLACVGLLALEREAQSWRAWIRVPLRCAWRGALLWSAAFVVLFSLIAMHIMEEKNPALLAAIARRANTVPAAIERLAGVRHGAREIELRLPAARPGASETLLSVGEPPEVDRVFVRWPDAAHVQFGFAREPMPALLTRPLPATAGTILQVRIELGALLPAVEHPWFDGLAADDARALSRCVRISVDGRTEISALRRFGRTVGGRVRVGARSLGAPAMPPFSGEIMTARAADMNRADALRSRERSGPLASEGDTLELQLRWPAGAVGFQPLVVTGATGAGDIFGVEFLGGGRARFFLDHWGGPLLKSEPWTVDAGTPHTLELRMESLNFPRERNGDREGGVRVRVDGALGWEARSRFHWAERDEVAVGENPIGGSFATGRFTGEITSVVRRRGE